MSRMNVEKKMKLMNVMESYWDMLPPEVHEVILAYKRSQEWIDEENKDRMSDLCMELVKYGELKRKWEIGHVKCITKKKKNICFTCYKHHLIIMGCHLDLENIPRERFLGFNFREALQRVNHVKSFL